MLTLHLYIKFTVLTLALSVTPFVKDLCEKETYKLTQRKIQRKGLPLTNENIPIDAICRKNLKT